MLPAGVVKGGTAVQLRRGESASRISPDFDVVRLRGVSIEHYIEELTTKLKTGWGGFTGRVIKVEPAVVDDVPEEYVMKPFKLKIAYKGSEWMTVRFEVGHDEVGSTAESEMVIADDLVAMFEFLGLPKPSPVPTMVVEHQVAQKIHACTLVGRKTHQNERAHDLVDLQILDQDQGIDKVKTLKVAERLFASRHTHTWPPRVVAYEGWDAKYQEEAEGLDVLPTVAEAVDWANSLIGAIAMSEPKADALAAKIEGTDEIGI
jgi:hypothetical protein